MQAPDSAKKHFNDKRESAFSSGQAVGSHDGRGEAAAAATDAAPAAAAERQDSLAKLQPEQRGHE